MILPTNILQLFPLRLDEIIMAISVLLLWLVPTVVGYLIARKKVAKFPKQDKVWSVFYILFGLFNVIYWPLANHLGFLFLMKF